MKKQKFSPETNRFKHIGNDVVKIIVSFAMPADVLSFSFVNRHLWLLCGGLKNLMHYIVQTKDNHLLHRSSSMVIPLHETIYHWCYDHDVTKTDVLEYMAEIVPHDLISILPPTAMIAGGFVRVLCVRLFNRFCNNLSHLSVEHDDIDVWNASSDILSFREKPIQYISIPSCLRTKLHSYPELIRFFDWTCTQVCIWEDTIYVTPAFMYSIFEPGAMFAACSFRNVNFQWPFKLDFNLYMCDYEVSSSTYQNGKIVHPMTLKLNLAKRYSKYRARGYRDVLHSEKELLPIMKLFVPYTKTHAPPDILYEWEAYWLDLRYQ